METIDASQGEGKPDLFAEGEEAAALLSEDKQGQLRIFKCKLTAYKKSFPGRFDDLNWSALEGDDLDAIVELYNDVQLTINQGYQKGTGMVGAGYFMSMGALEAASKFTNGMVMLDGLSMATAKNEEIKDILTQLNIEMGCYESVQSPELHLAIATAQTCYHVHMTNQQIRDHPEILERMKQAAAGSPKKNVSKLSEAYVDL